MRGFYNITERIRLQLAADEFVNTVTYGDIFRVDLKKQTLFPLSHVVVNNATMENNVWRYNISIMAMDIVDISKEAVTQTAQGIFRGNDNEQDVLNTQFAVLNRLLEVLRSGDIRDELYQLDGNPNLEPFTERFENFLAGWVATFDVLIPNDMTSCDATVTPSVICADATAITTDSDGNQLYSNTIPSGGTLTQPISDSVVTLKDTALNVLSTTNILAEGSADITAPDASYLVEYQNGTDIQSGTILSGGSVTIQVPNPIVCADTTLEVNGTIEGTVSAGSTVDVQLSDSGGVVTPTSVTQVGNDLQIVLPLVNDLFWELNFNGTDDVIFIPATVSNVGTLTSGTGSNVGTITISTDGVTYGALTFPFTPIAATTYYFKRSTATVTGAYTMTGAYV